MASYFTLTLDTVAPSGVSIQIAGGASVITDKATVCRVTCSDGDKTGYEIKIWGAQVDDGANTNIKTTEGAAQWFSWSDADIAVTFTETDESKTLNCKVRDSVYNESSPAATANVTLDTSLPTANVTVAPDRSVISEQATKNICTFSFQSDVAIDAWKVCVVPANNSTEDAGTPIPTTGGSTGITGTNLAANTSQQVKIYGADLKSAVSNAQGGHIIKVFVKEASTQFWSAS